MTYAHQVISMCVVVVLGGCAIGGEYGKAVRPSVSANQLVEACPNTIGPFVPWPPPPATGSTPLTNKLLGVRTVGDVDQRINSALAQSNYGELRYYSAPGGFALATKIEKISDSGAPLPEPERWDIDTSQSAANWGEYFDQLLYNRVGLYREWVFVVTLDDAKGSVEATFDMAKNWEAGGCLELPPGVKSIKLNSRYRISTLIYIFEGKKDAKPIFLPSFPITPPEQLKISGINLL